MILKFIKKFYNLNIHKKNKFFKLILIKNKQKQRIILNT